MNQKRFKKVCKATQCHAAIQAVQAGYCVRCNQRPGALPPLCLFSQSWYLGNDDSHPAERVQLVVHTEGTGHQKDGYALFRSALATMPAKPVSTHTSRRISCQGMLAHSTRLQITMTFHAAGSKQLTSLTKEQPILLHGVALCMLHDHVYPYK